MEKKYTITAFVHHTPGVLYRIADLFLRRKMNIDSLTVSQTERKGVARFTIVVTCDKDKVDKLVKQLYRVIEVIKAFESEDKDLIYEEIAFIKVSTKNTEKRREVQDLATLSYARIAHIGKDFLVVEVSTTEEKVDALYELLRPFGIKEFVRSGRIAVLK